jgi:hypothetical protein
MPPFAGMQGQAGNPYLLQQQMIAGMQQFQHHHMRGGFNQKVPEKAEEERPAK